MTGVLSEVNPAWFGAVPNDTTPDSKAIQQAINAGQKVKIGAGTYLLSEALHPRVGTHLSGSGKNITKLQFAHEINFAGGQALDHNPKDPGVLYGISMGPVRDVLVSDLTVDCNFGGLEEDQTSQGPAYHTTNGILLRGTGNVVRNVRITNLGQGTGSGEAFGINLSYWQATTQLPGPFHHSMNIIENCEVVGVGDIGRMAGSQITCMIATDRTDEEPDGPRKVSRGQYSIIRDCSVTDINLGPRGTANDVYMNCFSGSRIERCTASVQGAGQDVNGLYSDTGNKNNIIWRDNRLYGVSIGMHIASNPGAETKARSLEITGNFIDQAHRGALDNQTGIYIQQSNSDCTSANLEHILIKDNHFRANGLYSRAIRFNGDPTCNGTIHISDNIFDYQDFDNGTVSDDNKAYVLHLGEHPERVQKIETYKNNRYLNGKPAVSVFTTYSEREFCRDFLLRKSNPQVWQRVELGSYAVAENANQPRFEEGPFNISSIVLPHGNAPAAAYWHLKPPPPNTSKLRLRFVIGVDSNTPAGNAKYAVNLRRYDPVENINTPQAQNNVQGIKTFSHSGANANSEEIVMEIQNPLQLNDFVDGTKDLYQISIPRFKVSDGDTMNGDLRLFIIDYAWE